MTKRVSVAVSAELLREVEEHPEEFGLEGNLSEASKFARLVEMGARSARENHRRAERIAAYQQWSSDSEGLDVARMAVRLAQKDGLL